MSSLLAAVVPYRSTTVSDVKGIWAVVCYHSATLFRHQRFFLLGSSAEFNVGTGDWILQTFCCRLLLMNRFHTRNGERVDNREKDANLPPKRDFAKPDWKEAVHLLPFTIATLPFAWPLGSRIDCNYQKVIHSSLFGCWRTTESGKIARTLSWQCWLGGRPSPHACMLRRVFFNLASLNCGFRYRAISQSCMTIFGIGHFLNLVAPQI